MEERIKGFAPSWFAGIMGTGIFALSSFLYSSYIPFLKGFSYVLFYFNLILFYLFLIPWTLRWFMHTKEAIKDLYHPILSNFYVTIGAAMIVISSTYQVLFHNMKASFIYWIIGTLLTIFFSVLTPYVMFKESHVQLDHISPAWFIPPVALIVIPVSGSVFMNMYTGILREFIILLNYFGLGAGFFLFIILSAISMYRFILHHPLPNVMSPTVWVNLGPIGAGTIALMNLVKFSPFITVKEPFLIFSFIFWGFGIWWLIMAISLTLHYIKRMKIPFTLSWFAFIFPLGAYVASTHNISMFFKIKLIDYIGLGMYFLLAVIWLITFINLTIFVFRKKQ